MKGKLKDFPSTFQFIASAVFSLCALYTARHADWRETSFKYFTTERRKIEGGTDFWHGNTTLE